MADLHATDEDRPNWSTFTKQRNGQSGSYTRLPPAVPLDDIRIFGFGVPPDVMDMNRLPVDDGATGRRFRE